MQFTPKRRELLYCTPGMRTKPCPTWIDVFEIHDVALYGQPLPLGHDQYMDTVAQLIQHPSIQQQLSSKTIQFSTPLVPFNNIIPLFSDHVYSTGKYTSFIDVCVKLSHMLAHLPVTSHPGAVRGTEIIEEPLCANVGVQSAIQELFDRFVVMGYKTIKRSPTDILFANTCYVCDIHPNLSSALIHDTKQKLCSSFGIDIKPNRRIQKQIGIFTNFDDIDAPQGAIDQVTDLIYNNDVFHGNSRPNIKVFGNNNLRSDDINFLDHIFFITIPVNGTAGSWRCHDVPMHVRAFNDIITVLFLYKRDNTVINVIHSVTGLDTTDTPYIIPDYLSDQTRVSTTRTFPYRRVEHAQVDNININLLSS